MRLVGGAAGATFEPKEVSGHVPEPPKPPTGLLGVFGILQAVVAKVVNPKGVKHDEFETKSSNDPDRDVRSSH